MYAIDVVLGGSGRVGNF